MNQSSLQLEPRAGAITVIHRSLLDRLNIYRAGLSDEYLRAQLNIDPNAMSQALQDLEALGLVERMTSRGYKLWVLT